MWRGVATYLVARSIDNIFEIGTGRTFSIGSTDNNDRAMLFLAKGILDQTNAIEPKLYPCLALGVQALKMSQPVTYCFQAAAGNLSRRLNC
jgi:hypothetical protein